VTVGRLLYAAITSLDGYVADAAGDFGWAEPDAEVHQFVNDLMRPCGTHLYGRRLYEVMRAWETLGVPGDPEPYADFGALWRAADKVVYSRTLDAVPTARTTLERDFDPEAVRRLTAAGDVTIGGPTLAAHAFAAGLVDRVDLLVTPVVVGGGTPALPAWTRLDLVAEPRRFASGVVHLRYEAR
jgi:dihydrofolate reductase